MSLNFNQAVMWCLINLLNACAANQWQLARRTHGVFDMLRPFCNWIQDSILSFVIVRAFIRELSHFIM